MQVLYVDDDTSLTKIVELMLQGEGHVCHSTDKGKQAVTLAKRGDYDIIILDVMLPDIDGFEVIQRVRTAGVKTPFLIQSGLVDPDSKLPTLVRPPTNRRLNCPYRALSHLRSSLGGVSPIVAGDHLAVKLDIAGHELCGALLVGVPALLQELVANPAPDETSASPLGGKVTRSGQQVCGPISLSSSRCDHPSGLPNAD